MENSNGFDPSAAYRLDPLTTVESPVLVPLPGGPNDLSSTMEFCRQICPGAPLLVADFFRLHMPPQSGGIPSLSLMADRLAAIINEAMQAHDLSLIPIIVVGNVEGADLAACLGLAHGHLLAACILFNPTTEAMLVRPRALDGVHILLVQSAVVEANQSPGSLLSDVLKQAGAEIICERTSSLRSLCSPEAALARVFIAALFSA